MVAGDAQNEDVSGTGCTCKLDEAWRRRQWRVPGSENPVAKSAFCTAARPLNARQRMPAHHPDGYASGTRLIWEIWDQVYCPNQTRRLECERREKNEAIP